MISAKKPTLEPYVDISLFQDQVPDGRWQELWFTLLNSDWKALAIVPGSQHISSAKVAATLCDVAKLHRFKPVHLINGESANLTSTSTVLEAIATITKRDELALVIVDSPLDNKASIPIIRATDASLVCITLGESDFKSARRTLKLMTNNNVLGCVTLKPADMT